tara:strand:+ start:1795 stop:3930 length:2136 start_codon:yes stop_codon:yes gene_type:complete
MKTESKFNVYFNEYNLLMGSGGVAYLPLVSGILSANAKKVNRINENYKFHEFIFHPDTAENIIKNYYKEKPHIAAFSVAVWNEQLSLKVAKNLKDKYGTLIIFGGASTPHIPTEYFKKYPFIDVAVRAEGEDAFNDILLRYLENKEDFSKIPNVAYRDKETKKCEINYEKINFARDLDMYPSPYLTGEFDYLVPEGKDHKYQVIIETNRGCPFLCTYCYWGRGGTTTKYRYHSLERVYAEIDWIAKKKIKWVYSADSNYGMHKRDWDIAKKVVESKNATGFPEKFRTTWGKNTSEQIFKIANLLHANDLGKGITLARQTNSKEALKNVKRDNIKLEAYSDLERKFNDLKIPVYAEMIMSLPGETYDSWVDGLGSLLESYVNNQILIYPAEVYPNTEMCEDAYRKKYKIKTKQIKLHETHCSPKDQKWIDEVQEIVVGTYSMTQEDWKKRNLFSVTLMVMHSFKAAFYIMNYLKDEMGISGKDFLKFICENTEKEKSPFIYNNIHKKIDDWTDAMLEGRGKAIYNPKYSDVYLDIEEIIFLDISQNFETFYLELKDLVKTLVGEKTWKKNENLIDEIFKYQDLRMPRINATDRKLDFEYNIAEYMFYYGTSRRVKLRKLKNTIQTVNTKDYSNNNWEYTKKKIIWARKDDKIKNDIDYDEKILVEVKKIEKARQSKNIDSKVKYKVDMFDELNKFQKYSALEYKNSRSNLKN